MHFGDIDKIYAGTDSVSKVFLGTDLIWPYTPPTPVSGDYLTMQIVSGGTINWKASDSAHTKTISYSLNGGAWTDITSSTGGTSFNVNSGDTVLFKGDTLGPSEALWVNGYNNTFVNSTATFSLSGYLLSIAVSSGFTSDIPINGSFQHLFEGTNVVSASGLILPSVVNEGMYIAMFRDCSLLEDCPSITSTATSIYCYAHMFRNCTSLATATPLPATNLSRYCYYDMFQNCTSLTATPALPATEIAAGCYNEMFAECSSLVNVPSILPATVLKNNCYEKMFQGCTSLTTAPALPATVVVNGCYWNMFSRTAITTAPELPAETLDIYCYEGMFNECRSLNYVKCLATTIVTSSTYNWLRLVSATGTFVKAASATWETGDSGIPSGWTIIDNQ